MTEEKNTIVLKTTKFGEIEINKDSIFSFVSPIIGFNDLKEYLNSWPFNGNSYFLHLTNKNNFDFKFLGKNNINGKNCLKFSITDSDYQYIFYMDINSNLIIKIENYINNDNSLFSTTDYNYNLNYEDEIENFNPDNFIDYQKIPIENNN